MLLTSLERLVEGMTSRRADNLWARSCNKDKLQGPRGRLQENSSCSKCRVPHLIFESTAANHPHFYLPYHKLNDCLCDQGEGQEYGSLNACIGSSYPLLGMSQSFQPVLMISSQEDFLKEEHRCSLIAALL